jgi:hypothetical protein
VSVARTLLAPLVDLLRPCRGARVGPDEGKPERWQRVDDHEFGRGRLSDRWLTLDVLSHDGRLDIAMLAVAGAKSPLTHRWSWALVRTRSLRDAALVPAAVGGLGWTTEGIVVVPVSPCPALSVVRRPCWLIRDACGSAERSAARWPRFTRRSSVASSKAHSCPASSPALAYPGSPTRSTHPRSQPPGPRPATPLTLSRKDTCHV